MKESNKMILEAYAQMYQRQDNNIISEGLKDLTDLRKLIDNIKSVAKVIPDAKNKVVKFVATNTEKFATEFDKLNFNGMLSGKRDGDTAEVTVNI